MAPSLPRAHEDAKEGILNLLSYQVLSATTQVGRILRSTKGASQLECNTTEPPAETLPDAGFLRIAFISDLHNSKDMLERAVDMSTPCSCCPTAPRAASCWTPTTGT